MEVDGSGNNDAAAAAKPGNPTEAPEDDAS